MMRKSRLYLCYKMATYVARLQELLRIEAMINQTSQEVRIFPLLGEEVCCF